MDSFNYVNVKVEKANAISKYRRRQRLNTLFRFIELSFFLVVISRFSVQLPFNNIKISGEFLRGLAVSFLSTRFVFLIGNLIVVVLVVKSGWLSAQNRGGYGATGDFSVEIVENIIKNPIVHRIETGNENLHQKKESRNPITVVKKKMGRSKSASSIKEGVEKPRRQLRRVATESCREGAPAANLGREEELNGEEFRRKVEAFIARQQRNLREEEFSQP